MTPGTIDVTWVETQAGLTPADGLKLDFSGNTKGGALS